MKKIFYILLMGIVLCPACKIMAQSRNVIWVHGLSGDASSLEPHDTYFKALYQMNTFRPSVTTANGIQGAAQALYADLNSRTDVNYRNIVVAHSMGGVNSVWLHKYANSISSGKGSQYVGGLISMGSPYKGAYVANNIDNGVMDALISDGVSKGSKGVRSEPAVIATFMTLAPVLTAINALFGNPKPATLYDLMNMTASVILHYITDVKVTQSPTTRNSLKVGSSDINAIQQYTSFTVPSIALYGVEDYPATLRFITSRLAKETGQNEDFVNIVSLVNFMYQSSAAFSYTHSTLAITSLLTGNTLTETYQEWVPDAICENGIPYHNPNKGVAPNPICTSGRWETTTTTHKVIINEPGDGLLPVASPQAMPACLKKVEMQHTNHEEMKYSSTAQWHLNEIFAGRTSTTRNPEFFKLTKK